jgi:hypothetical protein
LLTRYNVWVDETDTGVNLTIGLPEMEVMGYTTQGFLDVAARACSSLDLGHLLCSDPGRSSEVHKAMKLRASHRAATYDDDEAATLTAGHDAAVRDALNRRKITCVEV